MANKNQNPDEDLAEVKSMLEHALEAIDEDFTEMKNSLELNEEEIRRNERKIDNLTWYFGMVIGAACTTVAICEYQRRF